MCELSGDGLCDSQRDKTEDAFPEIVLHIHLHICCLGWTCVLGFNVRLFNMYILFINLKKLSKWLNPVRLGKYVKIKYT